MHALTPPVRLLFAPALIVGVFSACERPRGPDDNAHASVTEEWPVRPLTIWTERHELFIEYELPVPPRESRFAVHVTNLADGSPRTGGPLLMTFRSGENTVEAPSSEPARPGIYLVDVALPSAGSWEWALEVEGDRPEMPEVVAFDGEEEARSFAGTLEEPPGDITMLKEQQWPVRLRVERATAQRLEERVPSTARVEPVPGRAAWLSAPATGSLLAPPSGELPRLGAAVEAGKLMAVLRIPFLGGDLASWESASLQRDSALVEAALGQTQAAAALESARAEAARARGDFERVEGLHRIKAKSDRELEEARYLLAAAAASEQAAEEALRAWSEALDQLTADRGGAVSVADTHLDVELRAPVSGRVVEAPRAAGEWLEAGAGLFHILDSSVQRVSLRVPEADLARLTERPRARLRHPVDGTWLELPGPEGRLLVSAPRVDPETRAGEVVFELPNPGWLRSGMTLEAILATGNEQLAIAVPMPAVVDDDGLSIVYVQTAGETFERRPVRTGIRDGDRVAIVEGLIEGEQVVVERAYVVRLVSLSGAIPEHAH